MGEARKGSLHRLEMEHCPVITLLLDLQPLRLQAVVSEP